MSDLDKAGEDLTDISEMVGNDPELHKIINAIVEANQQNQAGGQGNHTSPFVSRFISSTLFVFYSHYLEFLSTATVI